MKRWKRTVAVSLIDGRSIEIFELVRDEAAGESRPRVDRTYQAAVRRAIEAEMRA